MRLPFDTPAPESAPLRRSRRASAPQGASSGDAAIERSELRRRAADQDVRPSVVWARETPAASAKPASATSGQLTTSAPSAAPEETATTDAAPVTDAAPAPLTRRAARARAARATEPAAATATVSAPSFPVSTVETTADETASFELLEPVAPLSTTAPDDVEVAEAPVPAASDDVVDEFEAAARLFSFTAETPVQQVAEADGAPAAAPAEEAPTEGAEPTAGPEHVAPRGRKPRAPKSKTPRRKGASFTRVAATSLSVSAMAIVGLLAVGMTTPAIAVASSSPQGDVALATEKPAKKVLVDPEDIQAYVAPADVQNPEIDRAAGSYATASMRELAAEEGVTTFSSFFTNDPTAAIQWPFNVGVPMSFGWGPRWGAMHTGIDLTPGNGAEIHAIADGVVRSASDATGGYGVNIYIDHTIDGKLVTSHYAHMQYGSMRVKAGDRVKVGQVIGLVGNTGHSFGAHLHFEILLGGTQLVDPLPWMRKNAGRDSLGN